MTGTGSAKKGSVRLISARGRRGRKEKKGGGERQGREKGVG